MSQHDSARPPRFCPNCGAHNLAVAPTCTVCGQSLGKRDDFAKLWGSQSTTESEPEVIDLYPTLDVSSQATMPFTQTRPFDPNEFRPESGRSNKKKGQAEALAGATRQAPPSQTPPPFVTTASAPKGPPGCLLGCLALVIVAALAGFLTWHVVRAAISDRVSDEISVGVTNELQQIDDVPVDSTGQIVLTEADINATLAENAAFYTPVKNVRVELLKDEVKVRFELYGVESTFQGGLAVRGGKLVVTDAEMSGPAKQIMDTDDIAEIFEAQTNDLLRRFNLEPVAVQLRAGSLVIETEAPKTLTAIPDE